MYGICTYIWQKFMVYVGKCTIHGSYGIYLFAFKAGNDPEEPKEHIESA